MCHYSFLCRFLESSSEEAVSTRIRQRDDVVIAVGLEEEELFERSNFNVNARSWTRWNHSEDVAGDPLKLTWRTKATIRLQSMKPR